MNTGNHYRNVNAASDRDYEACQQMNALNETCDVPVELFIIPHDRFAATCDAWDVAFFYAKEARA